MWSPSFVPRCVDWPAHVDVVGDFSTAPPSASGEENSEVGQKPTYTPDPRLVEFLDDCGDEKPFYIGFGSMVISDAQWFVDMVKVSVRRVTGVGWCVDDACRLNTNLCLWL